MEECNLARRSEVANVDHVDVPARRRAYAAGSFLSDEDVSLFAGSAVVKPPHVVGLAADGDYAPKPNWIRDAADTSSADVPDIYPLVPKRGNENSIAHEHVVDERTSHLRGERLCGRCRIGDVDDHEPGRISIRRVDAEKSVESAVYALNFRRVYSGISQRSCVARDQLRLQWICQTVDHDRARRELCSDYQQFSIVACLDVAEGAGVGHDHRVDQRRHIASDIPDLDRVTGCTAIPPGGSVRNVSEYPDLGGVALDDRARADHRESARCRRRSNRIVGSARKREERASENR